MRSHRSMQVRILDLDGSVSAQPWTARRGDVSLHDLGRWGPRLRIHCGLRAFARFEAELADQLGGRHDEQPWFTLFGSGDFHHLSLALLRRQPERVNLLVLDKHSDWVRFAPRLHCGTWLHRAGLLPQVERIFHVGGDEDFDNMFRRLAPWPWLDSGRLIVFPAIRRFQGGGWNRLTTEPLRTLRDSEMTDKRIEHLLRPFRNALASRPLYISIDKDVLVAEEAVVNWDSGFLRTHELATVVATFIAAAQGNVAGIDTTGDWSQVRLRGWTRRFSNFIERRAVYCDPSEAKRRNGLLNELLVNVVERTCRPLEALVTAR